MLHSSIPLDGPPCPQCGARTSLMRRETQPGKGMPYELRTFDCMACGPQTYAYSPVSPDGGPALSTLERMATRWFATGRPAHD